MFFIRNYIENNLLSYYLINKYDYTICENCGIRKLFLRSIFLKILKKKKKRKNIPPCSSKYNALYRKYILNTQRYFILPIFIGYIFRHNHHTHKHTRWRDIYYFSDKILNITGKASETNEIRISCLYILWINFKKYNDAFINLFNTEKDSVFK